ncbi:MAG: hypothetical protein AAB853_04710 [Patescibacteria group bacterium]
MTSDLHPHWKSTDRTQQESSDSPASEPALFHVADEAPPEPSGGHVSVARDGSAWPASLSLMLAALSLAALSALFFYGIHRIRGDLLAEMQAPLTLEITDAGISRSEGTFEAGKKILIKNVSSSAQQLQSDQRSPDGSPLLSTSSLPAGEETEVTIPDEAVGMTLTLRSTILPTLAVSLSIAPLEEIPAQPSPAAMEDAEDIDIPLPVLPVVAPAPTPTQTPTPVSTASPFAPITSPVVTIAEVPHPSPGTSFPAILRINRYTVGSPYVPPVHAVRYAEEAVREALHPAAPRQQPETGPGLWISVLAAVGAMPFLFRKRRKP